MTQLKAHMAHTTYAAVHSRMQGTLMFVARLHQQFQVPLRGCYCKMDDLRQSRRRQHLSV